MFNQCICVQKVDYKPLNLNYRPKDETLLWSKFRCNNRTTLLTHKHTQFGFDCKTVAERTTAQKPADVK